METAQPQSVRNVTTADASCNVQVFHDVFEVIFKNKFIITKPLCCVRKCTYHCQLTS